MADRRARIVRAAAEIATERGMAALSVRSVAARVGIGASTLRHYFPRQRLLVEAVAEHLFDDRLDDLRIADRSIPAARRLHECAQQFLPGDEHGIAHLAPWLVARAALVDPQHTRASPLLVAAMSRRARLRVDAWLETLDAEGALRHPDRARLAALLFATVDGLCLALLPPEATLDVAEAHALLGDVIESMIVVATA